MNPCLETPYCSPNLHRTTMIAKTHTPVLLQEVLSHLNPKTGGLYLDCTFGEGGYSEAILDAAECQLIAIDRDPRAVQLAEKMQKQFSNRFSFVSGCFGDIAEFFKQYRGQIDGIVFDLGVSSPQLDEAHRGFSFRSDASLDMRMSHSGQTAADVVNTLPEKDLAHIIFQFGEERFARQIAKAICIQRMSKPIERTLELADLVRQVVPRSRDGIDPATRTFQALRIYVNDELGELKRGLQGALSLLAPGGNLVVVSFHSLEDRIVKQFIHEYSQFQAFSRHIPTPMQEQPLLTKLTAKPIAPNADEIAINPRARSAKLRAAQKIRREH